MTFSSSLDIGWEILPDVPSPLRRSTTAFRETAFRELRGSGRCMIYF